MIRAHLQNNNIIVEKSKKRDEKLKRNMFLLFVFLSFTILLISQDINLPVFPKGELTISQDGKSITIPIEIADNDELQSLGLMYREDIPKEYGMLFIFPTDGIRGFWMKNTYIALDIAFINSEGIILEIKTMEPCNSENCPVYTIYKPFRYALEVKAGFFEKYGFKPGARIQWRINNRSIN